MGMPPFRAGLMAAVASGCLLAAEAARAQVMFYPGYPPPRPNDRTYGPGLSFGEMGLRMSYREAYGTPYVDVNRLAYGFGPIGGIGFGSIGQSDYSSAFPAHGAYAFYPGFYPPGAAFGYFYQNPAIFPPPSPNWNTYSRGYGPPWNR